MLTLVAGLLVIALTTHLAGLTFLFISKLLAPKKQNKTTSNKEDIKAP